MDNAQAMSSPEQSLKKMPAAGPVRGNVEPSLRRSMFAVSCVSPITSDDFSPMSNSRPARYTR